MGMYSGDGKSEAIKGEKREDRDEDYYYSCAELVRGFSLQSTITGLKTEHLESASEVF